jgi:ATP-dependent DNA helicase DinG
MPVARDLIEAAFDRLAARPGYSERPDQRQLALLISDLIEQGTTGTIEAPTGLGKSLASLIPALAHAIAHGRRTVIATYTNVLAEQYWRQDLPLALELMGESVPCTLLMGRQRYACLAELVTEAPELIDDLLAAAPLGIESEIRENLPQAGKLWRKIIAPPACPARHCPYYDACYYYSARRNALKAMVIVTNHAVVLQDALMTRMPVGEDEEARQGLFGPIDFTILDEAHDLPQAATNALEYVLDGTLLDRVLSLSSKLEAQVLDAARLAGHEATFMGRLRRFREAIAKQHGQLLGLGTLAPEGGMLDVAPAELKEHPAVKRAMAETAARPSKELAIAVSEACGEFVQGMQQELKAWKEEGLLAPTVVRQLIEASRNYLLTIGEAGLGAAHVASASGGSVSYIGQTRVGPFLRHDIVDLREPLKELLWSKRKWACLSATLAIDGSFDHFNRLTGADPDLTEILPSPFDFAHAAAVYLPPTGKLLDPTLARKEGREEEYYAGLARELSNIIRTVGGRCLMLFHSRKEMEAAYGMLDVPPELAVYIQPRFGAGSVGSKFRGEISSSLCALRSFWTGFDAPGETLSCVVLVRVPFEVPTDPPQIVRIAGMQSEGRDPFGEHALPNAKLLIRQGVGRLIRRTSDRGVIALLDARLRTKRYGEEILDNLPPGMRTFDDIGDAAGWIGLGDEPSC